MEFLRGWPATPGEGAGRLAGADPARGPGLVLTVGSFDGLHRGHQALIGEARRLATGSGRPLAALFFEPTAREYFAPASAPPRVLPLASKLARLAELGVDIAWCLRFGRALAGMTAADFAARLAAMGVRVVVAGDDFRFGQGRVGDAALLERHGIKTHVVPAVSAEIPRDDGGSALVRCSSTELRAWLGRGEVACAEAVLGAPYRLIGRVRRGRQLGRTLGCPTANLVFRRRLALAHGVYAGTARVAARWSAAGVPGGAEYPAVASFGVRPTLEGGLAPWLEVHLLDASLDLYGQYLSFQPRHFLRPELRFDSLDALRRAIAGDVTAARDWLTAQAGEAALPAPSGSLVATAPSPDPFPAPTAGRAFALRPATTP